jgi:hypothetical protein
VAIRLVGHLFSIDRRTRTPQPFPLRLCGSQCCNSRSCLCARNLTLHPAATLTVGTVC